MARKPTAPAPESTPRKRQAGGAAAKPKPDAVPPSPNPPPTAEAAPSHGPAVAAPPAGLRIRMYRLGIGDSFLLTLPGQGGQPFHMLIDCGIHAAETGGPDLIRQVATDILQETGGQLDLVVGTHEHWDHLSGFVHAGAIFAHCHARAIWCAWTEDLRDPLASSLLGNRDQGVAALWGAVARLRLTDAYGTAGNRPDWNGVLGFFGDSPGIGPKAKAAAEAMRALVASPEDIDYREPGARPFDSVSDQWRIFVLGPPRKPEALRHVDPRQGSGEAYPLGDDALAGIAMAAGNLMAAISTDDARDFDQPFDPRFQIKLADTHADDFFQTHYWADGAAGQPDLEETQQDWRRINNGWLDGVETLALKLDKITNNTSLVLALELGPKTATDNPVILFAADAQVGNWQTWPAVEWPDYAGRKVSGADLLKRTVVYKVGHHASHNATLMEGGLETMEKLRLALVPTNAVMAGKVGWGALPWQSLLDRLVQLSGDRVLRSDLGASAGAASIPGITVAAAPLYFDIHIPL